MARKKVKEMAGEFQVVQKDANPGSRTPQTTTTVKAGNADAALDAATGGAPDVDTDEILIKKKGPGATPTTPTTGGVNSMESVRLSPKAITEAATYPYTIFLPRQFKSFLESEQFDAKEVGHGMLMKFDTKKQLGETVRRLNDLGSTKAGVILNGLRGALL